MEHTPDLELTDVKGIADSLAEHFREEGFTDANDVAEANVHEVTTVHSIGEKRAKDIIDNAQTLVSKKSYVNRQWDPYTQEYYDAGVDIYRCDCCRQKFTQQSVYLAHRRKCSERNE